MKLFNFDPAEYSDVFARQGWVHIQGGLTPSFLQFAQEQVAAAQAAVDPLSGSGIAGAKEQFVFDFPHEEQYDEMYHTVSTMCDLNPALTLSERHVKIYDADASPNPGAHKDRFASQVSMGLSLDVSEGSYLVLYPDTDNWVNPFLDAALRDSLEPHETPEVVLEGAPEVRIHDQPGDVIIFRGSAMWHLRRNSPHTVNVYLKFNEFGADPLGEDPATPLRRKATLDLVGQAADESLLSAYPVLSRRFDSMFLEYRREGWPARLFAKVWGQNPFPISEAEEKLLRSLDGNRDVEQLVSDGHDLGAVRRLSMRGAVDLVTAAGR